MFHVGAGDRLMEHSLEVFPIQRNLHFSQRSGNFQLLQKGFQLPGLGVDIEFRSFSNNNTTYL